jgi:UDP-2,3-diacylglucosamine hydrolase
MAAKLGLLAGGGQLPLRVIEAARASGRSIFVIALEGQTDPATVSDVPHAWLRLGAAGDVIEKLRQAGVEELLFAGRIRRPSLAELRPDWRAAKFFARIGARALGDDGLLRAIRSEFEAEGFRLVGVDDLLREALAPVGRLGSIDPDSGDLLDIRHGVEVARALGHMDVGQAVVVQQGVVLGVEAIEGTDALIERCASLRRAGPGGVLVKIKKPQQDPRLDLPTIGTTTVEHASAAGLRGIAVEAGGSLIVDREHVAAAADACGLFLVGIEVAK